MWEFEAFNPTSRFVTVDSDEVRKQPLAILSNVSINKEKAAKLVKRKI